MRIYKGNNKNKDPYGNPIGTRYDIVDAKTGKVVTKGTTIGWSKGFDVSKSLIEGMEKEL